MQITFGIFQAVVFVCAVLDSMRVVFFWGCLSNAFRHILGLEQTGMTNSNNVFNKALGMCFPSGPGGAPMKLSTSSVFETACRHLLTLSLNFTSIYLLDLSP